MIRKILNELKFNGFVWVITKVIKYPFNYQRRSAHRKMLQLKSAKQRFSDIYVNNLWLSPESRSGPGSNLDYTLPLRKRLVSVLKGLKIKTIVDAPCGDFNWMRHVLTEVDVSYVGCDIVDDLIDDNNNKYRNNSTQFKVVDICNDELPDCDLMIVRDCLFHLSYEDIEKFLTNLSNVKYKYLLTSSHLVTKNFRNQDIETGDYRSINLFDRPFSFDRSVIIESIPDFPDGSVVRKEMVLVAKEYVPNCLSR